MYLFLWSSWQEEFLKYGTWGGEEGAILNLTLQAALAISNLDLSQAYSYVIILFKIKNEQTKPNKTP